MLQEETKEENEKEVESKSTLEVELCIISQAHSYALLCPNMGAEVNITKRALFLFSISKIRDEALCGKFSFSACHTLFGRAWLVGYSVNCKGYNSCKN